ncbi:hypothetical protein FBU30_007849 [Linnemannia zychae]|nr:hypothetical protein FBU30_007849 [Linnemannia zychae]
MANNTSISNSSIFDIDDILDLLGQCLSPPELLTCCQVSQNWNRILIPWLWHTIDDSLHSWSRILALYDDKEGRNNGRGEHWIRHIFKKYGEHIRNLSLSWRILVSAAYEANCTNIRKLNIKQIGTMLTENQRDERSKIFEHTRIDNATYSAQWGSAAIGPLLSPEFNGVLVPSEISFRPIELQEQDWITAQHFWLLVQQNRKLRLVGTSGSLRTLADVTSGEYIQNTIVSLPELREVHNNFMVGDPYALIAGLQHLDTLYTLKWTQFEPFDTFENIKRLKIYEQIYTRQLFIILQHLPNLESLTLSSLRNPAHDETAAVNVGHVCSRLKRLFFSGFERALHIANNSDLANIILPWMPQLEHIEFYSINQNGARDIVKYNGHIKSIVQTRDDFTMFAKISTAPGHRINVFEIFLRDCPGLQTLIGNRHILKVKDIVDIEHPWICNQLQSLGCQIGGVERLTTDEQVISDRILSKKNGEKLSSEEQEVKLKLEQSMEQHRLVYGCLAKLTCLTRLDLSYELRTIRLAHEDKFLPLGTSNKVHPLTLDCLELTLASGLDLLAPLVNLEIFGFAGIDHRIGKPELEWMAANWPRLKILRGLTDDHQPRLEHDRRKAPLCEYMRLLRPDIKHESILSAESKKVK